MRFVFQPHYADEFPPANEKDGKVLRCVAAQFPFQQSEWTSDHIRQNALLYCVWLTSALNAPHDAEQTTKKS